MANTITKTPIVYYGGKTAILNHLLEMVPVHDVYTETFFGGGALFWAKAPAKNETINDRLDIVINFYRVLRNDYRKLKKMIDATLISRTIYKEAKAIIYSHAKRKVDRVQLAWAFWLTTSFAYDRNMESTTYSYSNDKGCSTPKTLIHKKEEFTTLLVSRIENAYIECQDALKILRSRNHKKAFHYLDPPYFHGKNNEADQGHYQSVFPLEKYEEVLHWCATECKGKFLLSNYNSDVLEHYITVHGWYKKEITHRIKAPRKSGPAKVEVLVSNYATPCGTLKLF